VANEPTYADFIVYEYLRTQSCFDQETMNEFPSLLVYQKHVAKLRNVAKYERAEEDTPITLSSLSPWLTSYENRPTLGYWGVRGVAAGARALLHHLNIDFVDKRYYDWNDW
jgi:hypothetical protein